MRIPFSARISEETQQNLTKLTQLLSEKLGFDVTMTNAFEYAIKQAVVQLENPEASIPFGKTGTTEQKPRKKTDKKAAENKEEYTYTLDSYRHDDEEPLETCSGHGTPRTKTRSLTVIIGALLQDPKQTWTGLPYLYLHELYKIDLAARDPGEKPMPYDDFVTTLQDLLPTLSKNPDIGHWEPRAVESDTDMCGTNELARKRNMDSWTHVRNGLTFEGIVKKDA